MNEFWVVLSNVDQTRPIFDFILSFSQHNDKYSTKFDYKWKKRGCVLGIRTWDCRVVGADESIEL